MAFEHVFRKAFLDAARYSIHHYPSDTSPMVSASQLAEWRAMMTKEEWQREVLALWVESAQAFFPLDLIAGCFDPELSNPNSQDSYVENLENAPEIRRNGRFFAGLDLGKQVDHSVLAVVQLTDTDDVRLIHKREFPLGTPYPEVIAYVARAHQIFEFDGVNVDKTGIGDAVVDELEAAEIPEVRGVFFTDAEKENMLNYLKLLMEKRQLRINGEDRQLVAQVNEQEYEYLRAGTARERLHLKFWHPKGRHDDQLYALALACLASKEAGPEPTLFVVQR
jgi:hypothetical protein